jgi:hypothetical protein
MFNLSLRRLHSIPAASNHSRKRAFSLVPGRMLLILRSFILSLLLLNIDVSQPQAQQAYFWSPQERIPQYLYSTEEPPYLIADQNQTVHAFNSQPLNLEEAESTKAVFYRQWTHENGWSFPNDIIFDARGGFVDVLGVSTDQADNVLMILQMRNHEVYYAEAPLVLAGNSGSWSTPIMIADGSIRVTPGIAIVAAVANDRSGENIVVIYGGTNPSGLYFVSSSDHGMNWTDPYPIYLTGDETMIVKDPKLFIGESNKFHAVWATALQSGFGGPAFYASFDPQLGSWSEPMELDEPGIRTPSVIETQGKILVSYHHINVNGNWWRSSSDGGETWSLPELLSDRHVGTNGAVSFTVDGDNVLHAFFGQRIDDNNHGMWHAVFNGTTWTSVEAVVRGPQIRDLAGVNGFDPRSARAVIVNGNTALVAWGTDGSAGTNGAWYSYKRLDAQELPPVPLHSPTEIPSSLPTTIVSRPEATETPAAEANTISDLNIYRDPPAFTRNPQFYICAGVAPAVLLLVGMLFVYYVIQQRKK